MVIFPTFFYWIWLILFRTICVGLSLLVSELCELSSYRSYRKIGLETVHQTVTWSMENPCTIFPSCTGRGKDICSGLRIFVSGWKISVQGEGSLFRVKYLCSGWRISVQGEGSVQSEGSLFRGKDLCLGWRIFVHGEKSLFRMKDLCSWERISF